MAEIEFHIKKSRFRVKSRFKESKCADKGHSLNRDFTVQNLDEFHCTVKSRFNEWPPSAPFHSLD